jgi:hypothetical protein
MNRYEKIKSKYPLYFRKSKGWEKRQQIIINTIKVETNKNNLKLFNDSIDKLDNNINKLFYLL